MLSKKKIKEEFSKDWKKHYQVDIFKEKGFIRKTCPKCNKSFWTLDENRVTCSDPPCENYTFIENTITKGKWDYIETWKMFERFFKKEGHTSIPRYPVVDRWRPDLYFTIASIQDFQRLENGNMSFEYPANPLVVPQVCLRFPDIPNVGVTGRHLTSFVMAGQHAFGHPKEGYFKDRCLELNFKFLTKEMGIPEKELVYTEDVWAMPDFSAFGPCVETFSRGLELVNSVFMQFQSKDQKTYEDLPLKVIDVGWGLERLVWFSNGTPAAYDSLFGPVTGNMKQRSSIEIDEDAFRRYSKVAGNLNLDEVDDIEKARIDAAKSVGVTLKQLNRTVEPMQAMYAIADHARTIMFASADGAIPSNVGGGYNLRAILRRAMNFIDRYNFDFTVDEVAEWHANYLKPMFPELKENIENMRKIVKVEEDKFKNTKERSRRIVSTMLEKETDFTEEKLTELYESHGITPELIEKVAEEDKKEVTIPGDFYANASKKHESREKKKKKLDVDLTGLKPTRALYYESDESDKDKSDNLEFESKIARIIDNTWVILDSTSFYPTGGGQDHDKGTLDKREVENVIKVDNIILHKLNDTKGLKVGDKVKGIVEPERRKIITQFHTATHVLGGALRKALGTHVWQAGAHKSQSGARLDITHFEVLTDDEIKKTEKIANEIIEKDYKVEITNMPRSEAEQKYGFIIYQGGGSPGKVVRIIKIDDHDVEACAGTHVKSTKEIGSIRITKTHKLQDGVIRVEFVVGKLVDKMKETKTGQKEEIMNLLGIKDIKEAPSATKSLFDEWKNLKKMSGMIFYLKKTENKDGLANLKTQYTSMKTKPITKDSELDDEAAIRQVQEILKVQPEHTTKTLARFKSEIQGFRTAIEKGIE